MGLVGQPKADPPCSNLVALLSAPGVGVWGSAGRQVSGKQNPIPPPPPESGRKVGGVWLFNIAANSKTGVLGFAVLAIARYVITALE